MLLVLTIFYIISVQHNTWRRLAFDYLVIGAVYGAVATVVALTIYGVYELSKQHNSEFTEVSVICYGLLASWTGRNFIAAFFNGGLSQQLSKYIEIAKQGKVSTGTLKQPLL